MILQSFQAKFKNFLLYYGVAIFICCTCFFQLSLVKFQGLCSWKGGGFGMFASIDSYDARILKVSLGNRYEQVPLYYIQDFKLKPLLKLRLIFSENNLEESVKILSSHEYIYDQFISVRYVEELVKGEPIQKFNVDRFLFEIYTMKFDSDTGRVTLEPVRERVMYVD